MNNKKLSKMAAQLDFLVEAERSRDDDDFDVVIDTIPSGINFEEEDIDDETYNNIRDETTELLRKLFEKKLSGMSHSERAITLMAFDSAVMDLILIKN